MPFNISIPNDDVYAGLIKDALMLTFPVSAATTSNQKLEGVVSELVGTHHVRFGPAPNPESLVAIRSIVRRAIENNKPIAILIPWGSKKPDNTKSIDIAEIMGLKMLYCLQQRVSQVYAPGISINIRIEDLSGWYIFEDEPGSVDASKKYVVDFESLITILGLTNFIKPIRESDLCSNVDFHTCSDIIMQKILAYLKDSDKNGIDISLPSFQELNELGWKGVIPVEQREYYYARYTKLYHCDADTVRFKLAKYLASCLARHKLNVRCDDPEWHKDFIELTFCPPVPGAPDALVSRRLYYRTIHDKYTRDHIPPWRGKGYLRIYDDNTVSPAVTSFVAVQDYLFNEIQISGFGENLKMIIDYVLK
jgi:hypothetical protein